MDRDKLKEASREYAETKTDINAGYILSAKLAFEAGAEYGYKKGFDEKFETLKRQKAHIQNLYNVAQEKLYAAGIEINPIQENLQRNA